MASLNFSFFIMKIEIVLYDWGQDRMRKCFLMEQPAFGLCWYLGQREERAPERLAITQPGRHPHCCLQLIG